MSDNLINALRRNHALEHATIAVLARGMDLNVRLVGRASFDGFYIYGSIPSEAIKEAASEGLARLQRGESELAVSPLCGTNITVAGILAGIACLLALGNKNRRQQLPQAILAATWAIMLSYPLGRAVQKYVTTSANLSNVSIKRITRRGIGRQVLYKVETTSE